MKGVRLGVIAAAIGIAGCAAFNPYIRHAVKPSDDAVSRCVNVASIAQASADPSLKYACEMLTRIESARSQIISSRSTLTALLFPIGGIVAYNASRGFNAATNTALTAGGFAGYSAVSTLAQRDRIRIYDSGIVAIACAIDAYEAGLQTLDADTPERLALQAGAERVRDLLIDAQTDAVNDQALARKLLRYHAYVDGVERWLDKTSPGRAHGPALRGFVRRTVATVNQQLTATVPTNQELAPDAMATFQSVFSSSDPAPTLPLPAGGANKARNQQLDTAMQALRDLYVAAKAASTSTATTLDLDKCKYADVSDAGVSASITPLHLGPGNAYAGKTVSLVRGGKPFKTAVSGGVAPYTATLASADGPDAIKADIGGTSGSAYLEVSVPAQPDLDQGTYLISVEDSTHRYARWLTVNVPSNKAPTP